MNKSKARQSDSINAEVIWLDELELYIDALSQQAVNLLNCTLLLRNEMIEPCDVEDACCTFRFYLIEWSQVLVEEAALEQDATRLDIGEEVQRLGWHRCEHTEDCRVPEAAAEPASRE